MLGFFLFLVLVAYPIFLIVSAIIGGGDSSGSNFDCYCECDDCFDNDDCE